MHSMSVHVGRLVADPEIKTVNGTKVAEFRIACDDPFRKDQPDFYNVEAWDKLAGIVEQYGKKGMMVLVQGRTKTRQYDVERDAVTFRQNAFTLRADVFRMLEPASARRGEQPAQQQHQQQGSWESAGQWSKPANQNQGGGNPAYSGSSPVDEYPF